MHTIIHIIIYTCHISSFTFDLSAEDPQKESCELPFPSLSHQPLAAHTWAKWMTFGLIVSSKMVWGSCNQIKWSGIPDPRLVCKKINTAEFKMKRVCPVLLCFLIMQPYKTSTGEEPWFVVEGKKVQFPSQHCLQLPKHSSAQVCPHSERLNTSSGAFQHLIDSGVPAQKSNAWELAERDMLATRSLERSSFSALASPSVICSHIIFSPEYHPVM